MKLSEAKISIIVPIFNAAKYLDRCIASIINQTHRNLEIILINDGSIDSSLEICKRYVEGENRIVLLDQENSGVASARNAGLNIASGDYIGFVDSDDFVAPEMFQRLVTAAQSNNADIVECGYYVTDSAYQIKRKVLLKPDITVGSLKCTRNYLLGINTTNFNWNKLYRREIFNGIIYPRYSYSEDFCVNSKAFYNCRKKITISDSYYYYVSNENSAFNKPFSINRLDIISAGKETYDFFVSNEPLLAPFAALYVAKYAVSLHQRILSTSREYQFHCDMLVKDFYQYYSLLSNDVYKHIWLTKQHFSLLLFSLSPKLYTLLYSLLSKLKRDC